MSAYESWIDRQIREAQERGQFDNLAGSGKPIPGIGGRHDDNWWIRGLIEREQIKPLLPTSLMLRKEREDIQVTVADQRTEQGVRDLVTDLNDRIVDSRRRRPAERDPAPGPDGCHTADMSMPPGRPYRHRPPTPAIAIAARVLAFVTLGLVSLWVVFLAGVGTLTIMWGPPCMNGPGCGPTFWSATGVALAGCAVTFVILIFALPLAWRRPSLMMWSLLALGVVVLTAVWAVVNARL